METENAWRFETVEKYEKFAIQAMFLFGFWRAKKEHKKKQGRAVLQQPKNPTCNYNVVPEAAGQKLMKVAINDFIHNPNYLFTKSGHKTY